MSKQHIITSIELDVPSFTVELDEAKFEQGYIVTSKALDLEALAGMVEEQSFELSRAAEDNVAWPVLYYKADLVRNIDILQNYELKAIKGVKTIQVFYPHTKVLGKLDFDQFGLKYDDITNLHILAETFTNTFGDIYARPDRGDIIHIDFLNQFFEVTDTEEVKTVTNKILYYDIKLTVVADRHAVAKDNDILDLGSMINSVDQREMYAAKTTAPVKTARIKKVWSSQQFDETVDFDIEFSNNFIYGIMFDEDTQAWLRFNVIDNLLSSYSLTGELIESMPIQEGDVLTIPVCKLAVFDDRLTQFDSNMYYTSPVFPTTLRPLNLVELQKQV
jgi:hypothetical protein